MNFITVSGNIGKDAELRQTRDGDTVLSFSIADNQGKNKDGTDRPPVWFNCSMFGQRAPKLHQWLVKGTPVTVVGNFRPTPYTAQDGSPRISYDIRVWDVALQGRAEGRQQEGGFTRSIAEPYNGASTAPRERDPAEAWKAGAAPAKQSADTFDDEDLPF